MPDDTSDDITLGSATSAPASQGDFYIDNQLSPGPGADKDLFLANVMQRESGGQNILNRQGPGGSPASSASGYWQMIDSTWREAAKMAGIDTTQYPRAIDAPFSVQKAAASALYDKYGAAPWKESSGKSQGLQAAGTGPTMAVPQLQLSNPTNPLAMQGSGGASGGSSGASSGSMALALMSALLPKGWGFHPVDYDPFASLSAARKPVASVETAPVKTPQVSSQPYQGPSGPTTVPSRVGQKLSLGNLQRNLTGVTSG